METSTAPTTYEQVAFFGGLTTLKATNESTGGALMLTFSRRTPDAAV